MSFPIPWLPALFIALLLSIGGPASAASNRYCGGATTPGDPSDLANVIGDQTLEYAVAQPANIVTCAKGYLLAKCGDYESAHRVFDKCIAAGYAGAMIWKALLLEEGAGVAQDSVQAAELLQRAAQSDDPSYRRLGKMHYATALHLGRGVQKNEAEAKKWFAAAAAEGSAEAAEFLRTGYHTGHRELNTLGAGTPTAAALAGGPTGDNASLPQRAPTAVADDATAAGSTAEVQGQKLERRELAVSPGLPPASSALALLLVASFLAGAIRQQRASA